MSVLSMGGGTKAGPVGRASDEKAVNDSSLGTVVYTEKLRLVSLAALES